MIEKAIRNILIRTMGFESYLELVSGVYLRLVSNGLLKEKYAELFYLEKIIKPGYVCLDIGANVGYYSVFMSKYAGETGVVHAVEPVALFAKIFRKNTSKYGGKNIVLHETALGKSTGTLLMGTPLVDGVLRHGLTHVLANQEDSTGMQTYQVPVSVPDELFASLQRLDFVKCDVEGYETELFPLFLETLKRFKPLIQIEISGKENIQKMLHILLPLGYKPHGLNNGRLLEIGNEAALLYEKDFYFIYL